LRQIEAGRRQVPRAVDQCLELGLALARDGDPDAQFVTCGPQFVVDDVARGVQIGGHAVFDQGFVELADGREAAGALQVIFRGADPGPFEPGAGIAIVGLLAEHFGVLNDGPVVILAEFGVVSQMRRGGPCARRQCDSQRDGSGAKKGTSARNQ
jgi:hypothetical protein